MSSPCVTCNKPKRWRNADGKCTDCAPIQTTEERAPPKGEKPEEKKL